LSGGKPLVLSTVHFECSRDTRLVIAGGTLVNLAAGGLFWALQRLTRASLALRYFFWMSMTVNLLQAGGYLLFSGVGNIGDWAEFVKGLQPPWAYRVGLALLGVASYLLFVWLALLELRPLIGSNPMERRQRAVQLTVFPYLAGGTLSCIAGLLNPVGMILVAISAAAASFGGTSGLAWMAQWLGGRGIPVGPSAQPSYIGRSWEWIIASAILSAAFIFLLGPSVKCS
jgi:hypothetical protein